MSSGVSISCSISRGRVQKTRQSVHVVRVVSLHLWELRQVRSRANSIVCGGRSSRGRVRLGGCQLGRITASAVIAATNIVVVTVVVTRRACTRDRRVCLFLS